MMNLKSRVLFFTADNVNVINNTLNETNNIDTRSEFVNRIGLQNNVSLESHFCAEEDPSYASMTQFSFDVGCVHLCHQKHDMLKSISADLHTGNI